MPPKIVVIDATVAKAAFALGTQTPHQLLLVDALIAVVAQTQAAILVYRDEHMRTIPSSLVALFDPTHPIS